MQNSFNSKQYKQFHFIDPSIDFNCKFCKTKDLNLPETLHALIHLHLTYKKQTTNER